MAEFAALPLFTDSWVADTAHLTRLERGIYLDLLVLCWRSPECRVPREIDWIVRKLMCSPEEIPVLEKVIAEFMSSTGNYLYQKRLRKEFGYIRAQHKKQSANAKARWNKEKTSSQADANNKISQAFGNAPSPSPSPSPSLSKYVLGENSPDAKANGHSKPVEHPRFAEFWQSYPRRAGNNPRKPALSSFARAVTRGVGPEVLIGGAKAYAASLRSLGKEGTEYVAQAVTWLNQERWNDEAELPLSPEDQKRRDARRILEEHNAKQPR